MLIALGILVVAAGVAFCITWPGFAPNAVTVGGNRIVSRRAIVARAAISTHLNLWLQNPHAIAARVESIPYVERADVHRVPPATIAIWVTERTPFAVVRAGNERILVDRTLRVLGPAPAGMALPVFSLGSQPVPPAGAVLGGDAVTLRDAYDALAGAHVVPAALSLDRFGGLVATMHDGIELLLGDGGDLNGKLRLIGPILAQAVRDPRRVAAVDLRAPTTPVLVYK
jgi:cell division septal protein FtsQ